MCEKERATLALTPTAREVFMLRWEEGGALVCQSVWNTTVGKKIHHHHYYFYYISIDALSFGTQLILVKSFIWQLYSLKVVFCDVSPLFDSDCPHPHIRSPV